MYEILMAGSGGEGILSMGQLLAYAAMHEGKEVSWIPSYGPEMRGGTANCSVIISEEEIASPMINYPDILVAMNQESMDKFLPDVKPGGIVFFENKISKALDDKIQKFETEMEMVALSLKKEAKGLGDSRLKNTVVLGAIANKTEVVSFRAIEKSLEKVFIKKGKTIIDENKKALEKGYELVMTAEVR
ncbi:2-oxoacid:acceptor oxidoreductase family protein [Natranaerofaba carboxydovora]|uniref:2-oxoacid:acceptor oxidoreductase family protein n=1 Tax=Natranaerofaba carboxydovora TaxID=2742683 RepID=UPI001F13E0A3|nr:2-oxoacid:acceptor oxidoreductase family protein [Natranaerofaba carboxydovora]UMZ73931.1 Pyruvate synthase subunit PorC [Natranaerofaba carboxydovora]